MFKMKNNSCIITHLLTRALTNILKTNFENIKS